MYNVGFDVWLQIVVDPSLYIILIRTWLLFQLWVVEMFLAELTYMHTPPKIESVQTGQAGSLVQFQAQQNSLQPAALSPLSLPWTSISTYLK